MQPTAPPFDLGVRKQDLPAILVHNADNLKFSDVRVRWFDGFPDYYTNALAADNFSGLTIKNFTGAAARKTLPAISLANGSGKDIRNARATAGVLLEEHNVR